MNVQTGKKNRLLLRKLAPTEHEKYINYIHPKHLEKYDSKTISTLSKMFSEKDLCSTRDGPV